MGEQEKHQDVGGSRKERQEQGVQQREEWQTHGVQRKEERGGQHKEERCGQEGRQEREARKEDKDIPCTRGENCWLVTRNKECKYNREHLREDTERRQRN